MFIQQYYGEIQNGNIPACSFIKQMLHILIDELNDPDLIIDYADSNKHIDFIEKECRHSEAPFAGKPFKLMLFQKAIVEALFAIKVYSDELKRPIRKYKEMLLLEGRKGGKTPFVAAISLAEFFCGEMGTKILYGSNDYEEAGLLFDATANMREDSPKLAACTHKNLTGIYFGNKKRRTMRGKYSYLNKGSIKKISAKTSAKEGRNIKVGVVDEIHEMKDNSLIMPIRQALSTQDEPLYIEITTEGFIEDGYLQERITAAKKVLAGEEINEHWLIFLYMQDSEQEIWQNPSSWVKSNPGLGVIKKISFLQQMVEEAKSSLTTRRFVLAKDFNVRQSSATAWLDLATIENEKTFDPSELKGLFYIGSLDFAETTDLCSAKALFVDASKNFKTLSMYFIPDTKADAILEDKESLDKLNPEKKNYREWEKQGLVTVCEGGEIDAQVVADWFYSLATNYDMQPYKIGYDNWHSKDFKRIIGEYFGESVLERIGMDFLSLSGSMYLLEELLKHKRLNYNNNPIDKWCLANTSCKMNNISQIMPVKKYGQSKNRIDGTLGFVIALAAYSRYKSDYMELTKGSEKLDY